MTNSKLFTLGPVQMEDEILNIGGNQLPYFRTDEFSLINKEVCDMVKKTVYTKENSEVVLLTTSGTGAMEASIINLFNENNKLLIINGGSFGQRFVNICNRYDIYYESIDLEVGQNLSMDKLNKYKNRDFDGLLLNACETSTGVLYDVKKIGEFCKQENLTFVVDAISTYLSDEYFMDRWNIDVTIISSQKALSLFPGLSLIVINNSTAERIRKNKRTKSLYFDLKVYLNNIKRGQTPFTPAINIILQLHKKLKSIEKNGVKNIILQTENIAFDFRKKIKDLPLRIKSERLSNTLTPLTSIDGISAFEIYKKLKDEHNIYVNPNGGNLKDDIFRVGHIGKITKKDNDILIEKLKKILSSKN